MSKYTPKLLDTEISDVAGNTDLNYWFQINPRLTYEARPQIVCKDGFSLSVQVGRGNYCSPRENEGPWSKVEVGFPSEKSDTIMEYVEDPENPTDTVYAYVPIELVEQLIDLHGGMV